MGNRKKYLNKIRTDAYKGYYDHPYIRNGAVFLQLTEKEPLRYGNTCKTAKEFL